MEIVAFVRLVTCVERIVTRQSGTGDRHFAICDLSIDATRCALCNSRLFARVPVEPVIEQDLYAYLYLVHFDNSLCVYVTVFLQYNTIWQHQ